MGQYFRTQTYSNAFGTLGQQQRKLGGQGDRLFVTAVVAQLPFGGFGVEHHVEGKLRQACLNISRGGSAVASKNVSPVSLTIDQQVFLSHLHQGVANRGIAVGVKLHGVAHNIGHLVKTAIIHTLHRVQDTSLHGFQAILDMGHGPLKDNV